MSYPKESDELHRANRELYGTPDLVEQYMEYPYQQVRCEIALKLLHEALASPKSPKGVLLELGANSRGIVDAASLANDARHVIYADIEESPLVVLRGNQQNKNSSFVLLDASNYLLEMHRWQQL